MKIAFSPARTRSLANSLQLGHGLNNVQGNIDDGLLPSEPGDPSSDDPIRALVLELIRHADDGAVIVVQRDGAESQEMDGLGKDGGSSTPSRGSSLENTAATIMRLRRELKNPGSGQARLFGHDNAGVCR